MPNIVGVRFKNAGRIYYFEPGDLELEVGNYVVAETERGLDLGWVVIAPYQVVASEHQQPLKPIARVAAPEDVEQKDRLRAQAQEALVLAREKAGQRQLPLKVVAAEYNLEGSLLSVFYTAEEQADYREVARDLAQALGGQVRFFPVGPRDEAKLMGARVPHYDICGRCLCCASWLTDFPNVSVKMAKFQNMPMDPFKLSGPCGRLLCCLTFEYPMYQELRGQLPRVGHMVTTPAGPAKVIAMDVLRQRVTLWFEDSRTSQEMTAEQLSYGTLVRPAELEEQEEVIVATAAARSAAVGVPATLPSSGEGEASPSATPLGAPAGHRRRRRRSRRRGNR